MNHSSLYHVLIPLMLSLFSMIASVAAEELDQAKGDSKEGFPSLDSCGLTKITFDPFVHKAVYTIGVHTNHGLETSFEETNTIFSDYLTATAGQKFDPPIQFHVLPSDFTEIFTAVENDEIDFLYSNAGVYSCIGTQAGATALATVVNSLTVRGQTFDLDVYGGVIAVRHDNTEINTITDLKDKIIGAGAIVDFMGGQLQVYEMGRAGMSYVNDPKQVVFTKDQARVVRGILDGTFDVGFIRTGQIEMTEDENGQLVDPDLFKIIEPKIFVMESGELFPFLHSTDIFPEWSFASLPSVPTDVQRVVQNALMDFQKYALIGEKNECIQGSTSLNETQLCDTLQDTTLIVPCDATDDLALVAAKAAKQSRISKFRTARSYFQIRSIQQEADFLIQDADGWHCARPANLYDGITCPEGYFKRNEGEYNNGCNMAGLSCDENEEYDCFCKPCVKAFEVDVYHLDDEEADPHLTDSMETFLPGCKKMQICATIEQRQSITMRIYDNMHRLGANVTVTVNAGEDRKTLVPTNIPGTVAYTFTVSDNEARVQVIEILVNGQPISQSPIRVMVDKAECDEDGNWIADSQGNCVCSGNTYDMAGSCLDSAAFFLIIFSAVFVTIGIILFFYLGYKKQQSDSVWHISVEELHFNEPPEIIGAGGFGVVILGQYRGTKVAVKRVLPPTKSLKGHIISISSGENVGVESVDVATGASTSIEAKKMSKKTKQDGKNRVKFGEATNSGDIESQRVCKSGSVQIQGSMSGSNKDWERFIMMHHSDNNILKILESATSSDHGSGDMLKGSASKSMVLLKYLPMWLRFDAHSRRVSEFVNEMRMLSRLRHPCITTVMGAVVTSAVDPMLVMEYMEYGSLHDLLHNETMTPGGEIILQVVRDIVQGIQFLHASKPPILHGDLKAKNILVDSRFRAKVADFGFSHFKCTKQRNVLQGTPFYMAPEYLRRRSEYTTACDIYSLAMIIYEIYARACPFEGEDPRKVLPKVCHPRLNKRPPIPDSCPAKMVELMKKCWSANAFFRPCAKDIDYVLIEMSSKDTEPLATAKERIRDTLKRKPTSLYDVFPKHIADALNAGKKVEAESHEIVTVLFSDIVEFTTISEQFTPLKVSNLLDRLYRAFDQLAAKHHIFKVETIGDAYMGVTNLDGSEYDTHVKQVAEYSHDAIRAASQILIDDEDPSKGCIQIRVGFHSGPVVSNVIGSLNPRYALFGDTVNTASRMESNSTPAKIHCTFASAQLLQTQAPDIPLRLRGMIKIKGKGKMKTYWVGDEDILDKSMSISTLSPCVDITSGQSGEETNHKRSNGNLSRHEKSHSDSSDHDTHVSHLTHDTVICDPLSDGGRDHHINVHTQCESHPTKIQMDGTIQTVDCFSNPGQEIC